MGRTGRQQAGRLQLEASEQKPTKVTTTAGARLLGITRASPAITRHSAAGAPVPIHRPSARRIRATVRASCFFVSACSQMRNTRYPAVPAASHDRSCPQNTGSSGNETVGAIIRTSANIDA